VRQVDDRVPRMRRLLVTLAVLAGALAMLAPISVAAESSTSGWGAESAFIGRYHVRVLPASGAVSATPLAGQAAVFSAVVSACQHLSAAVTRPTGGELTVFMREVKKGAPLVPSAILNLQAPAGNELVYLTYLTSSQDVLHAKINGGAFVGPVIGSFTGKSTGPGKISATAVVEGLPTVEANYVRFSPTAQP
jgi:hypothetical protein